MTATLTREQAALTSYLRRATWGLPQQRQQELWDELEEHVLSRAEQLEVLGHPPEEALTLALRTLGSPLRLCAALNGVHNMPKLILTAAAAALALSAALYAAAGGGGQPTLILPVLTEAPPKPSCVRDTVPTGSDITVVSRRDGVTCYTTATMTTIKGVFLSHTAFVQAVKAQGGSVKELPGNSVKATFPGGTWMTNFPFFTTNGERYYIASSIASSMTGMFRPDQVSLSGFSQPSIQTDKLRLQFGSGEQNVGELFYNGFGLDIMSHLLTTQETERTGMSYTHASGPTNMPYLHRLQTGRRPGEVVMVALRNSNGNYRTEFAPVQADGTVNFKLEVPKLQFVTDVSKLNGYLSQGRRNAVLVQVSTIPLMKVRSGIFLPAQATSDAN